MAKTELKALREMIAEAQQLLASVNLPKGRPERSGELLASAVFLADRLLETSPAAQLGKKGGEATAKRGSEYFRKIALMRKDRKERQATKESRIGA